MEVIDDFDWEESFCISCNQTLGLHGGWKCHRARGVFADLGFSDSTGDGSITGFLGTTFVGILVPRNPSYVIPEDAITMQVPPPNAIIRDYDRDRSRCAECGNTLRDHDIWRCVDLPSWRILSTTFRGTLVPLIRR